MGLKEFEFWLNVEWWIYLAEVGCLSAVIRQGGDNAQTRT